MSETLKSTFEPHQTYTERQRTKRLKDKRKRIFLSIQEYENSEPEQPPAERED
jgi:hypothetical protein